MRERRDVMLAHPLTAAKLQGYTRFFVQPKLNGERCIVDWFNRKPILLSSTGLEFPFLGHIKEALMEYSGYNWDGELYKHGMPREEIASIANRKKNRHPQEERLQLHIFDYRHYTDVQAERIVKLGQQEFNEPLELVPTFIATVEEITSYTNHFLEEGYEGCILRHPYGLYETKRSNALLKHKPTELDYYIILDLKEAVSENGEAKGMVGSFRVLSIATDDVFFVSAGKLLHSERVELWKNRESCIHKYLKVKHEKIRTDTRGIPVSCVAISVVDKEGE